MCNISFFLALILCYILLLTLWFLSSNFLGSYLIYFFLMGSYRVNLRHGSMYQISGSFFFTFSLRLSLPIITPVARDISSIDPTNDFSRGSLRKDDGCVVHS